MDEATLNEYRANLLKQDPELGEALELLTDDELQALREISASHEPAEASHANR